MRLNIFNVIFGLLVGLFVGRVAGQCPINWEYNGGYCYSYSSYALSWPDSVAVCRGFGAYLAEPSSEQKNAYLKQLATYKKASRVWLGGSDFLNEGSWQWSSTRATFSSGFTDWSSNRPDNHKGNENCLDISQSNSYKWNDAECGEKFSFICEQRFISSG